MIICDFKSLFDKYSNMICKMMIKNFLLWQMNVIIINRCKFIVYIYQ